MSGFTLWLTGLPCAGKTTIGDMVAYELERRGLIVERLDGDVVREHLSPGLGFSKSDRDLHVARIGWLASRLARAGAAVVVSVISPYEEARETARSLTLGVGAGFVEVHVSTPLSECIRRDTKGLYERALAGELPEFTGVTAPYEAPRHPGLSLDTTGQSPLESTQNVLDCIDLLIAPASDQIREGSPGRAGR